MRYSTRMDASNLPRLTGYERVAAHVCPRCDNPARVLYRANGYPPQKEGQIQGYQEHRFATGTLLVKTEHVDNGYGAQYPYYGSCGYFIPSLLGSRESLIDQLYARLSPNYYGYNYAYNQSPTERIVSFDRDAFLKAPWLLWATAVEKGEEPVALIPAMALLRVALLTGSVPKVADLAKLPTFSTDQIAKAPALFLKAIKAKTEPRSF